MNENILGKKMQKFWENSQEEKFCKKNEHKFCRGDSKVGLLLFGKKRKKKIP